jgi:uncharacterized membrane protein
MKPSRRHTLRALAAAVAAATAPALAQELGENLEARKPPATAYEKCYGVALAGQNDCSSSESASCAGTAIKDYDPLAYMMVPEGTCTAIETPFGFGSLEPINTGRKEAM